MSLWIKVEVPAKDRNPNNHFRIKKNLKHQRFNLFHNQKKVENVRAVNQSKTWTKELEKKANQYKIQKSSGNQIYILPIPRMEVKDLKPHVWTEENLKVICPMNQIKAKD